MTIILANAICFSANFISLDVSSVTKSIVGTSKVGGCGTENVRKKLIRKTNGLSVCRISIRGNFVAEGKGLIGDGVRSKRRAGRHVDVLLRGILNGNGLDGADVVRRGFRLFIYSLRIKLYGLL